MCHPIVQYEASGRTIEKRSDSGSNVPEYRINDKIEIMYNPNNTEEFIISGANLNITWIILVGLGIVFTAVGFFVIIKR